MYKVYIALCMDDSLYTGMTRDVEARYKRHFVGFGSRYTKQRKIKEILYAEEYATRTEAAKRERQIKGWRKEKKLNLIKYGKPVIS